MVHFTSSFQAAFRLLCVFFAPVALGFYPPYLPAPRYYRYTPIDPWSVAWQPAYFPRFALEESKPLLAPRSLAAKAAAIFTEDISTDEKDKKLSRRDLLDSVELGQHWLLYSQTHLGNFHYQYNWLEDTFSDDDNSVRQAGTLWALAALFHRSPSDELDWAIHAAFDFFRHHSVQVEEARFVQYPFPKRETVSKTGTNALVALALVETLRTIDPSHPLYEADQQLLDEFLAALDMLQDPSDGLMFGTYDFGRDEPGGNKGGYSDGEALLARVKAFKYVGRKYLYADIVETAKSSWEAYGEPSRLDSKDGQPDRSFFHWGSQSYAEIATSPSFGKYSEESAEQSVLMATAIVFQTASAKHVPHNLGGGLEGVMAAYGMAKLLGNTLLMDKFADHIDDHLHNAVTMQVGSPLANSWIVDQFRNNGGLPSRAVGGCQMTPKSAEQRIDITQHQIHATLLALEYGAY